MATYGGRCAQNRTNSLLRYRIGNRLAPFAGFVVFPELGYILLFVYSTLMSESTTYTQQSTFPKMNSEK